MSALSRSAHVKKHCTHWYHVQLSRVVKSVADPCSDFCVYFNIIKVHTRYTQRYYVMGGPWRHLRKLNSRNSAQKNWTSNADTLSWVRMNFYERFDGERWISKIFTFLCLQKWPMTSPAKTKFSKYRSKESDLKLWDLFMSHNDHFRVIGRQ